MGIYLILSLCVVHKAFAFPPIYNSSIYKPVTPYVTRFWNFPLSVCCAYLKPGLFWDYLRKRSIFTYFMTKSLQSVGFMLLDLEDIQETIFWMDEFKP